MTQFAFYQSGIRYADFYINGSDIDVEMIDKNRQKLTETTDEKLTSMIKVSPKQLFEKWQPFFAQGEFTFINPFQTALKENYEPTSDSHLWIQRNAKPAVNLIIDQESIVGFQIAVRNVTAIIIQPGKERLTVLKDWQDSDMICSNPCHIDSQKTVYVEMRDGIRLATEIFLPDKFSQQGLSTILIRTPYGREIFYNEEKRFVERGYAVAIQDTRGRNESEGEWLPMYYERDDGEDTITWLAHQQWSNEKIGMIGGSYGGYVQWAAASSGTSYLKALVSMVTAGGPFTDTTYKTGAPLSGSLAWFFSTSERKFDPSKLVRDDWDELLKVRPLSQIPVVGLGHEISGFSKFMAHQSYDDFFKNMDWKTRADKIHVPALIQSGWYDDNGVGTTEAIRVTNQYPKGQRKIILGPWLHGGNSQYDLGPVHLGEHALRFDIDLQHMRWFDHFLNGVQNSIETEPAVEYYTLNKDNWQAAESFPPENSKEVKLWLDANTRELVNEQPDRETTISFDYDPKNPAPHLIDVSANELEFPNDYAGVESRNDVLNFTSVPFEHPITITGWFKAHFYASSSAVNTDWVARLTDVTPTGESINIADNVMNAMFHGDIRHPAPLVPDKPYLFEIETQKTSIQLQAGHRLRLDITSSAENLVFPNSNTLAGANSADTIIAHQTIYTGGQYDTNISFAVDNNL